VFVLGAYPSALHITWTSPPDGSGKRVRINALPVDNEPVPFWDGSNEGGLVDAWRGHRFDNGWGVAEPAGPRNNGSSGRSLDDHYLEPLGLTRDEAWITDCLDTYRMSTGVERALSERFTPIVTDVDLQPSLGGHPGDRAIVSEALELHRDRLHEELRTAAPEVVITLGNAARRVFASVTDTPLDSRVLTVDGYGTAIRTSTGARWFAVAHPGTLSKLESWRTAHEHWEHRQRGERTR
jgi:uracil-DNA glycosylase